MTHRLAIRDAALELLNAPDRPIDLTATTRRWIEGAEWALPHMSVWLLSDRRVPSTRGTRLGGVVDRQLELVVECVASGEQPDDAEGMVEPLVSWAVQALGDTTLEDRVHSLEEERTEWQAIRGDLLFAAAHVVFVVRYQTVRGDLTRTQ